MAMHAYILDYMFCTAYNLLYVPLLHILDIRLAQIGEIPGAFSAILLQYQCLGQPCYYSSGLQLHNFIFLQLYWLVSDPPPVTNLQWYIRPLMI